MDVPEGWGRAVAAEVTRKASVSFYLKDTANHPLQDYTRGVREESGRPPGPWAGAVGGTEQPLTEMGKPGGEVRFEAAGGNVFQVFKRDME